MSDGYLRSCRSHWGIPSKSSFGLSLRVVILEGFLQWESLESGFVFEVLGSLLQKEESSAMLLCEMVNEQRYSELLTG